MKEDGSSICGFEGTIPKGNNLSYSSIAQSVERAAVNRVVVGSSPTRGVKQTKLFYGGREHHLRITKLFVGEVF